MSVYEKVLALEVGFETKVKDFLAEERGDTNFISIIVILGIVLTVAVAFIGFKDQIVEAASGMIEETLGSITGGSGNSSGGGSW